MDEERERGERELERDVERVRGRWMRIGIDDEREL